MKVLVIDVGGTHIKIASSDKPVPVKVVSGPSMTAKQMVADVLAATKDWEYDAISIGYPGPVSADHPLAEPHNLGGGWVDFPYQAAFPKPIHFINDAAMQALGGYTGGKMLFLGIGTGLGSALVLDNVIVPLELAHLPYKKDKTYEEYIGLVGLEQRGKKLWRESVLDIIKLFRAAFIVDYVVLGGGNAKLMKKLPEGVHLGANSNAITGGIGLWHQPASPVPHPPAPEAKTDSSVDTTVADTIYKKRKKGKKSRSKHPDVHVVLKTGKSKKDKKAGK